MGLGALEFEGLGFNRNWSFGFNSQEDFEFLVCGCVNAWSAGLGDKRAL